jgi:hypothetical protein
MHMKNILVFLLLFVGLRAYSQQVVPFEMGPIKVDSVYLDGVWIHGVGTDSVLAAPDDGNVVTESQLKSYVQNSTPAGISTLRDSVNVLEDSSASYGTRIETLEDNEFTYTPVVDPRNNSVDSVLTYYNGGFAYILKDKITEADSIYRLTDTTQRHNTRLIEREVADAAQDDSITDLGTRITSLQNTIEFDSVEVQLIIDNDTLPSTEISTGNIFAIPRRLGGYTLTEVTGYVSSAGDGISYAAIYRTRSGSTVNMTSSPAIVTSTTRTSATMNASYDDVLEGDWLSCKYYDTGSPVSTSLNVTLIFKK